MPRIDDRSPDPVIERMMQEHQKEDAKKQSRQEFDKKIVIQKASVEQQSKSAVASKTEVSKENIRKSQEQPAKLANKTAALEKKVPTSAAHETSKKNGVRQTRVNKDQNKKVDKKREIKKEDTKADKADKKRDEVVLETAIKRKQEKDMEDGFGERGSDDFFQQSVNLAAQSIVPASSAQATSAPPKIPTEILNQLVNQIFVGIDKNGLQQFVIELKGGILGGGQISVSTSGAKVNLKFSGLNASSKTLIRNSKDDLKSRLQDKNLSLGGFEII